MSKGKKLNIIRQIFSKSGADSKLRISQVLIFSAAVAVLAGLIAGFIGVVLFLSGALEGAYFFKAFSLETVLPERLVIIKQQQAVTITQDQQVQGLANKLAPSLVTFVKLKRSSLGLNSIYKNNDVLGYGFVLTADGWLVTMAQALPKVLPQGGVLVNNSQIYEIKDVMIDDLTDIAFVKINNQNFKATPLAENFTFQSNQSLFWLHKSLPSGQIIINELSTLSLSETKIINSTESLDREILVNDGNFAHPAPVFNLAGEVVGFQYSLQDKDLIRPIYHFSSLITSLLKTKQISRPYLGVNWINLRGNFGLEDEIRQKEHKGFYVESLDRLSPAKLAGIKAGDIIRKVNDLELNGGLNLSEIIQGFEPRDRIFINVLRKGENLEFEVMLDKIK